METIDRSFNLFIDTKRGQRQPGVGDNAIIDMNQAPVVCREDEHVRLTLQSFNMDKDWPAVNNDNNEFEVTVPVSVPRVTTTPGIDTGGSFKEEPFFRRESPGVDEFTGDVKRLQYTDCSFKTVGVGHFEGTYGGLTKIVKKGLNTMSQSDSLILADTVTNHIMAKPKVDIPDTGAEAGYLRNTMNTPACEIDLTTLVVSEVEQDLPATADCANPLSVKSVLLGDTSNKLCSVLQTAYNTAEAGTFTIANKILSSPWPHMNKDVHFNLFKKIDRIDVPVAAAGRGETKPNFLAGMRVTKNEQTTMSISPMVSFYPGFDMRSPLYGRQMTCVRHGMILLVPAIDGHSLMFADPQELAAMNEYFFDQWDQTHLSPETSPEQPTYIPGTQLLPNLDNTTIRDNCVYESPGLDDDVVYLRVVKMVPGTAFSINDPNTTYGYGVQGLDIDHSSATYITSTDFATFVGLPALEKIEFNENDDKPTLTFHSLGFLADPDQTYGIFDPQLKYSEFLCQKDETTDTLFNIRKEPITPTIIYSNMAHLDDHTNVYIDNEITMFDPTLISDLPDTYKQIVNSDSFDDAAIVRNHTMVHRTDPLLQMNGVYTYGGSSGIVSHFESKVIGDIEYKQPQFDNATKLENSFNKFDKPFFVTEKITNKFILVGEGDDAVFQQSTLQPAEDFQNGFKQDCSVYTGETPLKFNLDETPRIFEGPFVHEIAPSVVSVSSTSNVNFDNPGVYYLPTSVDENGNVNFSSNRVTADPSSLHNTQAEFIQESYGTFMEGRQKPRIYLKVNDSLVVEIQLTLGVGCENKSKQNIGTFMLRDTAKSVRNEDDDVDMPYRDNFGKTPQPSNDATGVYFLACKQSKVMNQRPSKHNWGIYHVRESNANGQTPTFYTRPAYAQLAETMESFDITKVHDRTNYLKKVPNMSMYSGSFNLDWLNPGYKANELTVNRKEQMLSFTSQQDPFYPVLYNGLAEVEDQDLKRYFCHMNRLSKNIIRIRGPRSFYYRNNQLFTFITDQFGHEFIEAGNLFDTATYGVANTRWLLPSKRTEGSPDIKGSLNPIFNPTLDIGEVYTKYNIAGNFFIGTGSNFARSDPIILKTSGSVIQQLVDKAAAEIDLQRYKIYAFLQTFFNVHLERVVQNGIMGGTSGHRHGPNASDTGSHAGASDVQYPNHPNDTYIYVPPYVHVTVRENELQKGEGFVSRKTNPDYFTNTPIFSGNQIVAPATKIEHIFNTFGFGDNKEELDKPLKKASSTVHLNTDRMSGTCYFYLDRMNYALQHSRYYYDENEGYVKPINSYGRVFFEVGDGEQTDSGADLYIERQFSDSQYGVRASRNMTLSATANNTTKTVTVQCFEAIRDIQGHGETRDQRMTSFVVDPHLEGNDYPFFSNAGNHPINDTGIIDIKAIDIISRKNNDSFTIFVAVDCHHPAYAAAHSSFQDYIAPPDAHQTRSIRVYKIERYFLDPEPFNMDGTSTLVGTFFGTNPLFVKEVAGDSLNIYLAYTVADVADNGLIYGAGIKIRNIFPEATVEKIIQDSSLWDYGAYEDVAGKNLPSGLHYCASYDLTRDGISVLGKHPDSTVMNVMFIDLQIILNLSSTIDPNDLIGAHVSQSNKNDYTFHVDTDMVQNLHPDPTKWALAASNDLSMIAISALPHINDKIIIDTSFFEQFENRTNIHDLTDLGLDAEGTESYDRTMSFLKYETVGGGESDTDTPTQEDVFFAVSTRHIDFPDASTVRLYQQFTMKSPSPKADDTIYRPERRIREEGNYDWTSPNKPSFFMLIHEMSPLQMNTSYINLRLCLPAIGTDFETIYPFTTPIEDTMTGDNSTTTLTLSTTPVPENNVSVSFDGVVQPRSNYSVSGTTLTFTTAPPTGVVVQAFTAINSKDETVKDGELRPNLVLVYLDATTTDDRINTKIGYNKFGKFYSEAALLDANQRKDLADNTPITTFTHYSEKYNRESVYSCPRATWFNGIFHTRETLTYLALPSFLGRRRRPSTFGFTTSNVPAMPHSTQLAGNSLLFMEHKRKYRANANSGFLPNAPPGFFENDTPIALYGLALATFFGFPEYSIDAVQYTDTHGVNASPPTFFKAKFDPDIANKIHARGDAAAVNERGVLQNIDKVYDQEDDMGNTTLHIMEYVRLFYMNSSKRIFDVDTMNATFLESEFYNTTDDLSHPDSNGPQFSTQQPGVLYSNINTNKIKTTWSKYADFLSFFNEKTFNADTSTLVKYNKPATPYVKLLTVKASEDQSYQYNKLKWKLLFAYKTEQSNMTPDVTEKLKIALPHSFDALFTINKQLSPGNYNIFTLFKEAFIKIGEVFNEPTVLREHEEIVLKVPVHSISEHLTVDHPDWYKMTNIFSTFIFTNKEAETAIIDTPAGEHGTPQNPTHIKLPFQEFAKYLSVGFIDLHPTYKEFLTSDGRFYFTFLVPKNTPTGVLPSIRCFAEDGDSYKILGGRRAYKTDIENNFAVATARDVVQRATPLAATIENDPQTFTKILMDPFSGPTTVWNVPSLRSSMMDLPKMINTAETPPKPVDHEEKLLLVESYYPVQLQSESAAYLRCRQVTSNVATGSLTNRFDTAVQESVEATNILAAIPYDSTTSRLTYSPGSDGVFFSDLLTKNLNALNLRVTDARDRAFPVFDSNQAVLGSRGFDAVIRCDVIKTRNEHGMTTRRAPKTTPARLSTNIGASQLTYGLPGFGLNTPGDMVPGGGDGYIPAFASN